MSKAATVVAEQVGGKSAVAVCPNPVCRATLVCNQNQRVKCPYCGNVFLAADHAKRVNV